MGTNKLQLLGNKVLRKIFGFKRDEVSWQFMTLHNEIPDLCRSPNTVG